MTQRIQSSLQFCSVRNMFLAILLFTFAYGQFSEKLLEADSCTSKVNCRDCIQTQHCAWCMQLDFGDRPRCYQPVQAPANYCADAFTVNPDTELTILIKRELTVDGGGVSGGGGSMVSGGSYFANGSSSSSYYGRTTAESGGYSAAKGSSSASSSGYGSSSASGGFSSSGGYSESGHSITQIYPQRVNLKLRVNEPHRIPIKYAQAEDYPVDLYYLMDLSKSMEDDKEKLSTLGDLLATEMRKITSNFNLGFGSFVDKVLMPYVSTVPKNLQEPCTGCAAPYGYHNIMRLSTDTYRFSSEVKSAKVSGNLDAPEGGFDAIMQAIVCRDQIGWRSQARRLLVFSTDAGFHYAGDGKLGGVIAPNDGECHLDNGVYTHSSIQDYPSISQINHKVIEQSINVIFAVTASQIDVYNKLSEHIEGSSSAILSQDSSNVVELIKGEYSKISSVIEMKDNASNDVKITYYSKCLNENGKLVQTNKCSGLKVGQTVTFEAEIVVTKCPENPADWNQVIQIYPVGVNESLTIDLTMLCGCGCETEGPMFEKHSQKCKGHGDLKCGICECDNSFFGRNCECSSTDISAINEFGNCRADKNSTIECSGKGTCICGVCECDKRSGNEVFSGTYCECDNFSCDRYAGQICAGIEHGECVCGKCKCKHGWTGGACECPASNDECMPPGPDGEICSGHGSCECGKCVCKATEEGRYSGKYCEKCPTCSGRCAELKECVQCQMYKNGPLYPDGCAENCTHFSPKGVEKVVIDESKGEYKCVFYDDEDCKFTFKYYENPNNGQIFVEAEEKRECPPKVFMLGIILMVIGAIVLIGLALLILWKVLTTIHDRREFARFEKERENARWDTGENPIYKQATSTFKNPTYAGK